MTHRARSEALIGRDDELEFVRSTLEVPGPGAQVLVLQGEAGIGKTTLWQAATAIAEERGYRVAMTRPTEAEARLPFAGLNDLFGDLVDAALPALPGPQQAALDVALMRASGDGEQVQPLALSLAVLELLRITSAERPLALAIDDVQWLDESSAGILRFALRRLSGESVVVVASERTGEPLSLPAIAADLTDEQVTRIPVAALDAGAIDRLLERALGLRLAPTTLHRVHRMAGGNPLHALELGRAIQARGADRVTGLVPVPESLGALLRERIASLPPDGREVAAHAAALSQPSNDVLEAALGRERVRDGLAAARDAGIIASGGDQVRFTHPLLAAEADADLAEDARREMHRTLAAAVSEPEERARHLALAAAGPDPDVAVELEAAADHAAARGAPDAAGELWELAAGATSQTDPARAHRLAEAGRHRRVAGDLGRARDLLERALEEPAAAGGPGRAELLFRLSGVRQLMDDFGASELLAREALSHVADNTALEVHIRLLLAGVSFITGRNWAEGAQNAAHAMELADEVGDRVLQAAALGPLISWRYATGQGLAPEHVRRAEELAPWTVSFRALDLPEYDIAGTEVLEGHGAAGYAQLQELAERAEREGDYSSLPFLLANLSARDFLEGDRERARDGLERASRLASVTGQRIAEVHILRHDVRLSSRLGDVDRALEAGTRTSDLMDATGWRAGEWLMRADLATLELSRGDSSAALEFAAAALEPGPDESDRRRWTQSVAVEALVTLGRQAEAHAVLDDLEAGIGEHASPGLRGEALRARARLLAAEGDAEGADAAITEAEAIHRRMDDRWEIARTLLVAGEVHRRVRRRAKARAALREALELFVFLGAGLWAKQVREQLARIDAARDSGELTPTQRSVAELVASGLTNRQVADRLFMSPHTVDAHLKAIYRSLGISSRGQLRDALTGS